MYIQGHGWHGPSSISVYMEQWQHLLWGNFNPHLLPEINPLAQWGPQCTEVHLKVWAWLTDGLAKLDPIGIHWAASAV